uniref:Uncharacterized protein n=1 Tax=viral metagenome TaxID=1070528 RepID=A0A6M3LU34_9ZZZZ
MGFICDKCGKDVNIVKIMSSNVYHCLDCFEDIRECYYCHKTKPVKHCQWFSSWTSNFPDDDYGSKFYEKHTCYACDDCRKKYKVELYSKDLKG